MPVIAKKISTPSASLHYCNAEVWKADSLSMGRLGWWAVFRGATYIKVLIAVDVNVIAQKSQGRARLR